MSVLVFSLLFCLAAANLQRVVYGNDDRVDPYQAPAALKEAASATVLLVPRSRLTNNQDGTYSATTNRLLVNGRAGCSDEPFKDEGTLGFCSGTLVSISGRDFILSAGHCLTVASCATTAVIFDYANTEDFKIPIGKITISEEKVFFCNTVARRGYPSPDFIVFSLDRKVSALRKRMTLQTTAPKVGTALALIGNPSVLPTKVAGNAVIKRILTNSFDANVDAYAGNSGSLVVNLDTNEQVGILVAGNPDYNLVTENSVTCFRSNKCPDTGCQSSFETVTRIDVVLKSFPTCSVPTNDECSKPSPVTAGTLQLNPFCTNTEELSPASCDDSGIDRDVWYSYTAPINGKIFLSTCGSTVFDTKLAAYEKVDSGCPATPLACDDDGCGIASWISFSATAGKTYLLRAGLSPGANDLDTSASTMTFRILPENSAQKCPQGIKVEYATQTSAGLFKFKVTEPVRVDTTLTITTPFTATTYSVNYSAVQRGWVFSRRIPLITEFSLVGNLGCAALSIPVTRI